MFKLVITLLVIVSGTMIQCRQLDLPISSGCKEGNSNCRSGTECCSGICRNEKCFCDEIRSCNNTNIRCCPGTVCRTSNKECCQPSGKRADSSPECCFSSEPSGDKYLCCSGHAQSCLEDSECCQGSGKCSKMKPWVNICLHP